MRKERIFANEIRPQRGFFVSHHHPPKSPLCLIKSLPNMTYREYFSEIVSLTSQIRTKLPPLPRISQTASRPTCFLSLSLEYPNQQALSNDLSKLGVGGVCRDMLVDIFIGYMKKLRRMYEAQYENVFIIWQQHDLYDENYNQAFRNLLKRLFATHSQETLHIILDEASKVFQNDSSSTRTQIEDSTYEGAPLKTGRGHDSEAVRILEQAFKHSPNITPAEKFRLSEVTGLKPKQVTIWVSA